MWIFGLSFVFRLSLVFFPSWFILFQFLFYLKKMNGVGFGESWLPSDCYFAGLVLLRTLDLSLGRLDDKAEMGVLG